VTVSDILGSANRCKEIRESIRTLMTEYLNLKSMDHIDFEQEEGWEPINSEDPENRPVPTGKVPMMLTDWLLVGELSGFDENGSAWSSSTFVYSDNGLPQYRVKGMLINHLDSM
jgi:hypothetical protein